MKNFSVFLIFSLVLCLPVFGQNVFPFGEVRAWSGTLTVEGSGSTDVRTTTYTATGNFTLTDEMMPDGNHWQWPFPQTEGMSDPKAIENAFRKWNAKVTYHSHEQFKDAVSQANYDCRGEEMHAARFQFIAGMGMPNYMLSIEVPGLENVHCAGTVDDAPYDENMDVRIYDGNIEIQLPATSGRSIEGTKEITLGEMNFRVTYALRAE